MEKFIDNGLSGLAFGMASILVILGVAIVIYSLWALATEGREK